MKSNEMRTILILIIVGVLIILGIVMWGKKGKGDNPQQQGELTKTEADGTVVNISEKVNEDKKMKGFDITNVELKEKNGETILKARVTNNTKTTQERFFGKIVFLDQSNKEIGRTSVDVPESKAGETIQIEVTITEDYVNAYDYRLEK